MRRLLARVLDRYRRRHRVNPDLAQRAAEMHRAKYSGYEALGQDHVGPT